MARTTNRIVTSNAIDFFGKVFDDTLAPHTFAFLAEAISYPQTSDFPPGSIRFRVLDWDNKAIQSRDSAPVAFPKNPYMYTKPVPGEIIKIEEIQGNYMYSGLHQQTQNENGDFLFQIASLNEGGTDNKKNTKDYEAAFSGQQQKSNSPDVDTLGFTIENSPIPSINEKPGDSIVKGHRNNDIILSYDDNGNPIIAMVVQRTDSTYDVNTQGIHIYSDHDVDKELNYTIQKKKNTPNESAGGSTVINNAKLRLWASNGTLFLAAKDSIGLSSDHNITIDTLRDVLIDAQGISLGANAKQALLLGDDTIDWLSSLVDAITKLTVLVPQGQSSAPVNIAIFKKLKTQLKNLTSKQNKTL